MLLYLEKDLDRAYKIDCKERAKKEKPWVHREEFRNIYEELIDVHLHKEISSMSNYDEFEIYPEWILDQVDKTLLNKIEVILEDNT
tara:strand:+ start:353 stop:610 length:258 start_codon:yes stop_codon:yes gene_type:complete